MMMTMTTMPMTHRYGVTGYSTADKLCKKVLLNYVNKKAGGLVAQLIKILHRNHD